MAINAKTASLEAVFDYLESAAGSNSLCAANLPVPAARFACRKPESRQPLPSVGITRTLSLA